MLRKVIDVNLLELFSADNGNLVELDVSRNKLQSLPESLGEIYLSLRNLNASSNMLKTIPSSMVGYFASLVQTVYTRYGFYHEYSSKKRIINLADNPDLDIKDMIASDRGQDIGNLLERRREQGTLLICLQSPCPSYRLVSEKEQKAAQERTREQTKQVDRELRAEEKKDRQRERKNSEKSRTKNLRMDRNE
jgi:Leucine-rich repeat (LRR) protein